MRVFKAELEQISSIYKFEVIIIHTFNSIPWNLPTSDQFDSITSLNLVIFFFLIFSCRAPVVFFNQD